jgi:hypothetical protein
MSTVVVLPAGLGGNADAFRPDCTAIFRVEVNAKMKVRFLRSFLLLFLFIAALVGAQTATPDEPDRHSHSSSRIVDQGRATFRFDTFGDQEFWGDTLQLHQAIEGAKLGGVGLGVSPATALAVGLKVDEDALPPSLQPSGSRE